MVSLGRKYVYIHIVNEEKTALKKLYVIAKKEPDYIISWCKQFKTHTNMEIE